jgi:hypothetical protein
MALTCRRLARDVLVLAASLRFPGSAARAQDASAPEEVELTVGADGLAAVREVRSAQLVAGESALRVLDVSPQLLAESLALRALSNPELLELRQQTAWFEVLDGAKALEKLGGRPVSLFRYHESGVEKLEGRLLFPPVVPGPNGDVRLPLYLEQPQGRIRLIEGAEVELDALPPGDWNRFRLDWKLACKRADRYRLELLYLTRGLTWRADWLLRVAADGATADLTVTATIDNSLGVAWRGARLAVAEASALVHPVADGATLEARSASQFLLAQGRDLKVRVVPSFAIDLATSCEHSPVVRRFDLVDAVARGITRPLPAGEARVVLLDAKNRPSVASTRPVAASAGDSLSFVGDSIPGIVASCDVQPVDFGLARRVSLRLWSEREEKVDVEVCCPVCVGERIDEPTVPPDRSTPGLARFVVTVPARSKATLQFDVSRP